MSVYESKWLGQEYYRRDADASRAMEPAARSLGDVYGWTFERVLRPAWERYVKKRPILEHLDVLERTQWLSAEEIERFQVGELRALLQHAQRSVPYYRELFAKIGFDARDVKRREDIAPIPVLTKDIIRERYEDLIDPAHRGRNLKKGTSGSTGTPLKFEYSRESYSWREATKIRGYRWGGYRIGGPTLHYWAQVQALAGKQGAKVRLDRRMNRDVVIDSMHNDEDAMYRAVDVLRAVRPACLVVYTQSCAMWARFILDKGLRDWPDIPVLCGAEAVLPQDRAVLARAFGDGVFESYGSRETMLMASECCAHDGMHLSEENILLEIAKNGEPVPAGESGDVVVTDLHNFGMPFIRYVNGDVGVMHESPKCSCGRGLRRIRRIEGRRADTLTDKEGKPIPGIVFHVLFSDARREIVSQFQVVQKKTGEITLKYVRGQDWDEAAFKTIVNRFDGYLRGLPLQVQECANIPAQANGKRKTIIVEK